MNKTLKNILFKILQEKQYKKLKKLYLRFFSFDFEKLNKIFISQTRHKCNFQGEKVSILCCCFNTHLEYLKKMLDSVLWQTYPDWELCVLDCSDEKHQETGTVLESYAQKDSRIKLVRHANQGIAMNSNYIAQYAHGKYLLLLDHDDLLAPIALAELLKAAEKQSAEFVYADEYLLYAFGYRIRKKMDFELQALWHDNYLNHPVLIKKSLFDEVGGFRSGFDGSQDYDLYLRLIEKTKYACHVRRPLYVWRIHETSFSQKSIDICIASGKKALEEHLARTGVKARITAEPNSAIFHVK